MNVCVDVGLERVCTVLDSSRSMNFLISICAVRSSNLVAVQTIGIFVL